MSDGAIGLGSIDAMVGFCGKLPSRGDFVEAGLPRAFAENWDAWLQTAIAGSAEILGGNWTQAWLRAPVWSFRLPSGACGPEAAMGVWMPSVDRVGRHFPITLAAVGPDDALDDLADSGFLERAEAAGRRAVAEDDGPDTLRAELQADNHVTGAGWRAQAGADCVWWTAGAPRVPPGVVLTPCLPEPIVFARMLDAAYG